MRQAVGAVTGAGGSVKELTAVLAAFGAHARGGRVRVGFKRPRRGSLLETWYYPTHLGQPLPTLPIWLDVDLSVSLDLESSYEETCRFLRIS